MKNGKQLKKVQLAYLNYCNKIILVTGSKAVGKIIRSYCKERPGRPRGGGSKQLHGRYSFSSFQPERKGVGPPPPFRQRRSSRD